MTYKQRHKFHDLMDCGHYEKCTDSQKCFLEHLEDYHRREDRPLTARETARLNRLIEKYLGKEDAK